MRLQSPWTPRLADIEASTAERLVLGMADDIVEGRLKGGDRLPAHRDLAWKLGIGLGTVTKAYAALERRGLTRSVKGRGTFVAIRQAHERRQIDLSSNTPPTMLTERLLARTLAGIAKKIDPAQLNLYAPPAGHLEHRRLLARWLETLGVPADPSHLVLTGNARQAIALAFDLVCNRQGVILTERLTYPGAIALARRKGLRMRGVEIDAEGMVPEALAAALAQETAASKAVYLTPTLHNPTTATMGLARRQRIVAICRRAGAHIVEDGVYAFTSTALPPLAALAPDITVHVNGLSKSLGPGLRIGVLALPAGMMDAAEGIVRDMPMEPSPLSCAVVEEWMASGVIASVQKDLGHETRRRSRLASSLLGKSGLVIDPAACHAWLQAPRGIADRLALAAAAVGIKVTQPESVMAEREDRMTGIRLCLGGPSFEELTAALSMFAELLKNTRNTAVEHQ
ncbi:DNA-binding transcriptional MocR family regulator [Mesorhizobium soli]|uniref:aminotransferase-like domain-containing protein n=1 Tax=Pseudaminobacter soli (ex Li et al. 2025) TaxID=1295366 RepID=UPI002475260F|nr:PLP-dependent aminotransferase family protein [Mesorhizobium soli]MDH6232998.1 DNA-binding transcriptional MocR family regulator [Mesorhizobium soli]